MRLCNYQRSGGPTTLRWGLLNRVTIRRAVLCVGLAILLTPISHEAAADPVMLRTSVRNVQVDGFLLEWKSSDAKMWTDDSSVVWDAMMTPEGVAGYFRSRGSDSCRVRTFTACFPPSLKRPCIDMKPGANDSSVESYRINADSSGTTVEWLLRWKDLPLDSSGGVTLGFGGSNPCGPALEPVFVTCGVSTGAASVLTPRVKAQIAAIVLLFVAFLVIRHRVVKKKKKNRRL